MASRPTLPAGSIVSLVSAANQVLTARPRGKPSAGWSSGWELRDVPMQGDAQGEAGPEYLPIEALFVLLRRGEQLGFKSLGADGRTIQAVEALNKPHRIYNHNFSAWESWEDMGGELVNSQWRHKKLGYKMRLVVAVPADTFARLELQHKRELMRLQKQLEKLGVSPAVGRDELDGPSWEAREVEVLRQQLAECQRSLQHWQREAAVRQASLADAQQQGAAVPSQAAATIASLRADLREEHVQHAAQLSEVQAGHTRQLELLRREHSAMLNDLLHSREQQLQHPEQQRRGTAPRPSAGDRQSRDSPRSGGGWEAANNSKPAAAALREQVAVLQRRLQMAAAERNAAVGEARAEMQAALHAKDEEYHRVLMSKDAEIYWLLEERQRLDLALHTIKDMTAIVRQASPATAVPLGSSAQRAQQQQRATGAQGQQQGQHASQELSASGSGRDSGLSMESPTLLSPILAGLTVLGVPVPKSGCQGGPGNIVAAAESPVAETALSNGDEGTLSGAVSIAAEVPSSSEDHQAAQSSAAELSNGEGGRHVERQGSSSDAEQRQQQREQEREQRIGGAAATSSSQEGEEGSSSTAAGPVLSSGHLRLSGPLPALSPQLPLVQPWEVHGAVDLGAALAAADLAAGPLRQSMPAYADTGSMGPPPPRRPAAQHAAGGAPAIGLPAKRPGTPRGRPKEHSQEPVLSTAVQHAQHEAPAEAGAILTGGRRGGRSYSPGPPHPVFNPDMRSRFSMLYDLLNPFEPGSVAETPRSEELQRRQRQEDLISVAHLRGPPTGQPEGVAGGRQQQQQGDNSSESEGGSMHRVPIGGSYLVDYNGPRPDSITEDAMMRILDGPLPHDREDNAGAEAGAARWRGASYLQQQLDGGTRSACAPPGLHHPPASSAPASVAGASEGDASPGPHGCGGGWASGSLSLPGSSRATPLLPERDRAWEARQDAEGGTALEDLRKEHVAARRNRGPAAEFLPTEAVKAMSQRSPGGADAVAQLMADGLTMRASMPEGGWLTGGKKAGHTVRRLDLLAEDSEEAPSKQALNPLRRSAPAGPTRAASPRRGSASREASRLHPLRRSSFLQRAPVAGEMLFGN